MKTEKNKSLCKVLFYLCIAIISMFTFSFNFSTVKTIENYFSNYDVKGLITYICALFIIYKSLFCNYSNFSIIKVITSCIISILFVIGISFDNYHDFSFFIASKTHFVISVFTFITYSVFIYSIMDLAFSYISNKSDLQVDYNNKLLFFLNEHFYHFCFYGLILLWFLQSLPYFPASSPHDGRNQLLMYYGVDKLVNHHPIFASFLMGYIYNFGYHLGGHLGGAVIYVAVQGTLAAFVFAKICDYIKSKTSIKYALFVFAFYAFVPEWWSYINAIIKDTYYFIFFTFFTFECIKFYYENSSFKNIVLIVVTGIMTCLFRGNGIYSVAPTLLFLIFITKQKKTMLVMFLIVTFVSVGANKFQNKYFNPQMKENQDLLEYRRLQFQCLARYINKYENEISNNEKLVIDKIVDYNKIKESYNPENSDYLSYSYIHRPANLINTDDWKNINSLTVKFFKKHPVCYFEAFFNNCYKYLYPFNLNISTNVFYNKLYFSRNDINIKFSEYINSKNSQNRSRKIFNLFHRLPIISLILHPATYTIIGLLLVAYVIEKKKYCKLVFYISPFMNILVCVGCAIINGYTRYALPIMASMPLYILIGLKTDLLSQNFTKDN